MQGPCDGTRNAGPVAYAAARVNASSIESDLRRLARWALSWHDRVRAAWTGNLVILSDAGADHDR